MANEAMRECWGAGAAPWVTHQQIFDAAFVPFTAAVMGAADPGPGDRVVDVGCGAGTLLAATVERGAAAVGVDVSPAMVDAARRRVPAATVVLADAQTADLGAAAPGPPFTRVVSRFGVMFFDDPAAAFANLRRAAAPGARLAFVCWRGPEENPVFRVGTELILARVERPGLPAAGAPGPMAFADPDRPRDILARAGWQDVSVDALDGECRYGVDGSDGVEERLVTLLGSSVLRGARAEIEGREGPDAWAALLAEVRAELRRHLVDGVLTLPGATWLVTASNPG